MNDHRKAAGRANLGMALFINVAWLFVGGILTFWIGASQLPWVIVGILVTMIGITGINLAVSQQRLP